MELLKLLSANEIFVGIINFLILFFILRAFLWDRILRLLDERKEKIAAGLEDIERRNAEALTARKQYEEKVRDIEELKKEKIHDGITEGQRMADEIKKDAHQEAKKIIKAAMDNTEFEINKARDMLKDRIVDLAILATEQVLESKVTEEKDREIVKGFLDSLDVKK